MLFYLSFIDIKFNLHSIILSVSSVITASILAVLASILTSKFTLKCNSNFMIFWSIRNSFKFQWDSITCYRRGKFWIAYQDFIECSVGLFTFQYMCKPINICISLPHTRTNQRGVNTQILPFNNWHSGTCHNFVNITRILFVTDFLTCSHRSFTNDLTTC